MRKASIPTALWVVIAVVSCAHRAGHDSTAPDHASAPAAEAAPANTDVEPAIKMHRLQAGTADASGWYLARSTHGKFTVLMPAPFNDFEVVAPHKTTGAPIYMHMVGTQLPNGVKYSAQCTEGGDKRPDLLTTFMEELARGQPVRNVTIAGKPAAEFTVADGSGSVCVVDLGSRFCMMIVEAQDKAQLSVPPEADVQRMFDSFKPD